MDTGRLLMTEEDRINSSTRTARPHRAHRHTAAPHSAAVAPDADEQPVLPTPRRRPPPSQHRQHRQQQQQQKQQQQQQQRQQQRQPPKLIAVDDTTASASAASDAATESSADDGDDRGTRAYVSAFHDVNVYDDRLVDAVGYRLCVPLVVVFCVLCVATAFLLIPVCYWFPVLGVRLTHVRCSLARATMLAVRHTKDQRIPDAVRVHIVDVPSENAADTSSGHVCRPVVVSPPPSTGLSCPSSPEPYSNNGGRAPSSLSNFAVEEMEIENVASAKPVFRNRKETSVGDTPRITMHMATYKCFRYVYSKDYRAFVRVVFDSRMPFRAIHEYANRGITETERHKRELLYGVNTTPVPSRNIAVLVLEELATPFWAFQIACFFLWIAEEYYTYACYVVAMTVVLVTWHVVIERQNLNNIANLVEESIPVNVVKFNENRQTTELETIDSSELIPGDVVAFDGPVVLPCDMILVSGNVVVDESVLTGESDPHQKYPLPKTREQFSASIHKRHTLFAGTKILCIKDPTVQAMGFVTQTSFDTAKGGLLRSILHPPPSSFSFTRDAGKLTIMLFVISCFGMIFSIWNSINHNESVIDCFTYALDLPATAVPPELPTVLAAASVRAVTSLRKKHIYCTSGKYCNEAGKVDVMAFDKTGTITEPGLEVVGVALPTITEVSDSDSSDSDPQKRNKFRYSRRHVRSWLTLTPPQSKPGASLPILACCHSLTVYDGEIIGDPIDVKMFEFTKWRLEEWLQGGELFTVTRPHMHDEGDSSTNATETTSSYSSEDDEESSSSSSSTSSSSESESDDAAVGTTSTLMKKKPHRVRWSNFVNPVRIRPGRDPQQQGIVILKRFEYTADLQRQIVIAKSLPTGDLAVMAKGAPGVIISMCHPSTVPSNYKEMLRELDDQGMRVLGLAGKPLRDDQFYPNMPRDMLERDLEFRGLLVLSNSMKEESPDVIAELNDANIRTVMVTGDSLHTAVSVARQCGIVSRESVVYYGENVHKGEIIWQASEAGCPPLNVNTLKPMYNLAENRERASKFDYVYAVHGRVFGAIATSGNFSAFKTLLKRAQVFARMKPDQKRALMDAYEEVLDVYAGMCGDGANDCAALKAARTGISLGTSEASIAAPFTSTVQSISVVPELIKQGRCALSSSTALVKFMVLYSLIYFAQLIVIYICWSELGDWQFFYIDLIVIIPMFFALKQLRASPVLAKRPPETEIMTMPVLGAIAVQVVIQVAFYLFVYLWAKSEPWFVYPHPGPEIIYNTHPCAITFLYCNFQYLIIGFIFARGRGQHAPVGMNIWVVLVIVCVLAGNLFLLFQNIPAVSDFFQLPYGGGSGAGDGNAASMMESLSSFAQSVFSSGNSKEQESEIDWENPDPIPLYFRFIMAAVALVDLFVSFIADEIMSWFIPFVTERYEAWQRARVKRHYSRFMYAANYEFENTVSVAPTEQYSQQRPTRPQKSPRKKQTSTKSSAKKADTVQSLLNMRRDQRIAEKGKFARPQEPVVAGANERTSLLWTPQGSVKGMRILMNEDSDSSSTETL